MGWLPAFLLSVVVALAGRAAGALTAGGAAAAIVVGFGVLVGAGWTGAAALAVFFIGSSAVSRWLEPPEDEAGRTTRRDATQVFANGGAAALGAVLASQFDQGLARWVATAALAAAGADTWATAVGTRSTVPPRLLLRRTTVPRGTSGGVTFTGTVGAVVGSGVVAAAGAWAGGSASLGVAAMAIGVAGCFLDSALGDALQGRFHCAACDAATERQVHRCGRAADQTGGFRWLTNDGVNGIATVAAALAGWGAWASWSAP